MDKNTIRSIIFLIAGLALILFPNQMLKMQSYVLKKFNVKQRDTKKSTITLGIILLIISAILLGYSITN